jgi:hypothetical protein
VINAEIKPTLHLQMFKRHLYTGADNSEDSGALNIRISGHERGDIKDVDMSELLKEQFSVSVHIVTDLYYRDRTLPVNPI